MPSLNNIVLGTVGAMLLASSSAQLGPQSSEKCQKAQIRSGQVYITNYACKKVTEMVQEAFDSDDADLCPQRSDLDKCLQYYLPTVEDKISKGCFCNEVGEVVAELPEEDAGPCTETIPSIIANLDYSKNCEVSVGGDKETNSDKDKDGEDGSDKEEKVVDQSSQGNKDGKSSGENKEDKDESAGSALKLTVSTSIGCVALALLSLLY